MKLPLLLCIYVLCSFCLNNDVAVFANRLNKNRLHASVLHQKKGSKRSSLHDKPGKVLSLSKTHGKVSVKGGKKVLAQQTSPKVATITEVKKVSVKSNKIVWKKKGGEALSLQRCW